MTDGTGSVDPFRYAFFVDPSFLNTVLCFALQIPIRKTPLVFFVDP